MLALTALKSYFVNILLLFQIDILAPSCVPFGVHGALFDKTVV